MKDEIQKLDFDLSNVDLNSWRLGWGGGLTEGILYRSLPRPFSVLNVCNEGDLYRYVFTSCVNIIIVCLDP